MRFVGALLIVLGVLGSAWALWAAYLPIDRASAIRRWIGAVVAPLAIFVALVGVVLAVLPEFFSA